MRPLGFVSSVRWIVPVAASMFLAGGALASQLYSMHNYVMTGSQEVPPNGSTAICSGAVVVDTVGNTFTYNLSFTGLSAAETAAHIHGPAAPGVNAPVLAALPTGNPKAGFWNYPQSSEADILAGRIYMNIHDSSFPAGEIRGQVDQLRTFDTSVKFLRSQYVMTGAQEVPPTGSAAVCTGSVQIDTLQNKLHYNLSFTGMTETVAHIHGPAGRGINMGVLAVLPVGNPKVGTWNYPQAREADILAGNIYMNIHSTTFPAGEIRGQLDQIVPSVDQVPSGGTWGRVGLMLGLLAFGTVFIVRRTRVQASPVKISQR